MLLFQAMRLKVSEVAMATLEGKTAGGAMAAHSNEAMLQVEIVQVGMGGRLSRQLGLGELSVSSDLLHLMGGGGQGWERCFLLSSHASLHLISLAASSHWPRIFHASKMVQEKGEQFLMVVAGGRRQALYTTVYLKHNPHPAAGGKAVLV
jgi:hypothetical protein